MSGPTILRGSAGRRLAVALTLFGAASLHGSPVLGGDEDHGRWWSIGGLAFGDFYYISSHHTEDGDGAVGVVLRRGYLTFDAELSERWDGRLRFEVNQSGEFETYDFEADVKDLFARLAVGRHRVLFGLSPARTFDLIERVWGRRYLMRTPLDLQGVASRDTGVSAEGPLNRDGSWSYRAMLGSGINFGAESGDGRKLMLAATWRPSPSWLLDLYADHEKLPGRTDRTTLQAFLAWERERWRWALQYSHEDRQDDPTLELASTFLIAPTSRDTNFVGRIDRLIEPSPRGDNIPYIPFAPTAPATMFNVALEVVASDHIRITPNVIVIAYDDDALGVRPQTDVHWRLTLFFNYE